MKYLISLLLSINFLNASMLYDSKNICIEDYYTQNNNFYFLKSSNLTWYSETATNQAFTILPNHFYDSVNNKCVVSGLNSLGLSSESYNFLLALCGFLFGGVFMFFTIQIFMNVGGRKWF